MRSKFYTDDYFTPLLIIDDDVAPVLDLYKRHNPDIITVTFDLEGTGPGTYYKVLQVIIQALRLADKDYQPQIWGYRNVWYQFHPAEATMMIPVSQHGLEHMNEAFLSCFSTQRKAAFSSPNYDGPFSKWSEETQKDQRKMLSTLLGEDYFTEHSNRFIRNSVGFVFLKSMTKDAFLKDAEDLRSRIELQRS